MRSIPSLKCDKLSLLIIIHFFECQALSILRWWNLKTEVSPWKRIKCFPYTPCRRNQKNATITGQFRFVFEENSVREITWLSWRHRFRKAPFSKWFPSTRKREAGVFKFVRSEERFRKAPFSWQSSVDGGPNRGNKAAFSNFSGAVWTLSSVWEFGF